MLHEKKVIIRSLLFIVHLLLIFNKYQSNQEKKYCIVIMVNFKRRYSGQHTFKQYPSQIDEQCNRSPTHKPNKQTPPRHAVTL